MNPLIELLADAQSDDERKDWLLSCPLYYFVSDYDAIVRVLRVAGFLAGIRYIDQERASLMARRNLKGMVPGAVIFNQHLARGDFIIFQRHAGEV